MIRIMRRLAQSIREYKRPSILTLFLMVGEAVIETLIPFITANYLINVIRRDAENVDISYILTIGVILAVMALFSLGCGGIAGLREGVCRLCQEFTDRHFSQNPNLLVFQHRQVFHVFAGDPHDHRCV